jgi:hypothetical protein
MELLLPRRAGVGMPGFQKWKAGFACTQKRKKMTNK